LIKQIGKLTAEVVETAKTLVRLGVGAAPDRAEHTAALTVDGVRPLAGRPSG
jgi:hypothetical protein